MEIQSGGNEIPLEAGEVIALLCDWDHCGERRPPFGGLFVLDPLGEGGDPRRWTRNSVGAGLAWPREPDGTLQCEINRVSQGAARVEHLA